MPYEPLKRAQPGAILAYGRVAALADVSQNRLDQRPNLRSVGGCLFCGDAFFEIADHGSLALLMVANYTCDELRGR